MFKRMVQNGIFFPPLGVRWYVEAGKNDKHKGKVPSMGILPLESYDNKQHLK